MFRSLATRLTATYVFAAIVLVVIVFAAVTAFALSIFGIAARGTTDEVARQVPEEVRLEIGRSGSLRAAAADISRHLSRPGLRVAVFEQDGLRRRFLAASFPGGSPGGSAVVVLGRTGDLAPREPAPLDLGGPPGGPGGPGGPESGGPPRGAPALGAPPPGGFGGPEGFHHYDRMAPYPFSLNFFLHLEPRDVGVPGGAIVLVPDPGDLIRAINAFWLAMLPIGLFVVAAAWLLGRYITGQALRPLVETTSSLRRFGDGDFTATAVTTTARDEIGELARAYNAAAAQVSSAFENRRAAEMEMRQFIADAGHELRTPLTVIMGFVDVLRRRSAGEPGNVKIFDTMQAESRRMKDLIDKLILLARLENAPPRELETVDLAQIAGDVTTSLGALAGAVPIGLSVEPDALVRGYEGELQDAVSNLVENALKYAPESPVEVSVGGDRSTVTLEVRDRGPGIPSEEHTQVFARFYRGRERADAEGFGLGLAIAKRAVERAGGTLSLESEPGKGCRFTMRIPRATRGERVSLAV